MEKIMDLLINADNVRMMLMVMIGYCWYVKLGSSFDKKLGGLEKRIDGVEHSLSSSLNKRIDDVEHSLSSSINQLKTNDIAHLNSAIKALTFTLEKKKLIEREDKEFVDSMLG